VTVNWGGVKKVLVVKLRSIGDTVLSTPSLIALRRFLPEAQIDILLEDWVAPVLKGLDSGVNILPVGKSFGNRISVATKLFSADYDVAFNLHGGPTSTFFVLASGATERIGYSHYQYKPLYTQILSSSSDFWKREDTHSVEQQLALLGHVGVPVSDLPATTLGIEQTALQSIKSKLEGVGDFALMHPAAAFETKQWDVGKFVRVAEFLYERGITTVATVAKKERAILDELITSSKIPIIGFDDLTLPEVTALASRSKIFVGNDSGIAHIAAAVGVPPVVIFGSSNVSHWRPWGPGGRPNGEVVRETFPCQPCPGYTCGEYGDSRCITTVSADSVISAINRILTATA